MGHHTRQIDGGLDARVAPTNHGHTFAFEQRAIAMRAVRHAFVFVLLFAGHVHIAPTRTCGDDDTARAQHPTVGHVHLHQATHFFGRHNFFSPLQIHDVHFIVAHLRFQSRRKLGAIGFKHRDVVLNRHGVVGLATKTLGGHTHAYAFASGVDSRCCTGRTASHDQHIKRLFLAQLDRFTLSGVGVEFA